MMMRDLTAAVVAIALFGGIALADSKDGKKQAADGAGSKTVVIQIDASKLPPELLAKLLEATGNKPVKSDGKKADDKKPGDGKPGDKKPGDKKQDDKKSGDGKPGDKKPTDKKPDGKKAGDGKPGDKTLGTKKQISRAEAIAAAETLLAFLKAEASGAGDKSGKKKGEAEEKPGQQGKKKQDEEGNKPGSKGKK